MRLLLLLCLCLCSLVADGDLKVLSKFLGGDLYTKERTSLNADFDVVVVIPEALKKLHIFVINKDNTQAYRAQDFLKRATPKEKASIKQSIQEAHAYESTPPKIRDILGDIALLSLKPLEGTDLNIAQIKNYDYTPKASFSFFGAYTSPYQAWLVDKSNTFGIKLTGPAFGSQQASQMIEQSVQEMQGANERYYHHNFNALFDLIPPFNIITLKSKNPHAKELYRAIHRLSQWIL